MERMGDVRSDFHLVNKKLNITIFTDNHPAREQLERGLPLLGEILEPVFEFLVMKVYVSTKKIADFDTEDLEPEILSNRMLDLRV